MSFRGKVYQQVHSTAMESPVSVVVTTDTGDMVMEGMEGRALDTYYRSPCSWKCYVDDTFPKISLILFWTTSVALSHPSNSQWKRRRMDS